MKTNKRSIHPPPEGRGLLSHTVKKWAGLKKEKPLMDPIYLYCISKNPNYDKYPNYCTEYALTATTVSYWNSNHCVQDHDSEGLYNAVEELGFGIEECACTWSVEFSFEDAIGRLENDARFRTDEAFTDFLNSHI